MILMVTIMTIFILLLAAIVFVVFKLIKANKKDVENENDVAGITHTTQDQLPFEYIRRGIVKLKNGIYVKILSVPSVNTQLMEGDEKELVRDTYASILNSISHPIQIQFYKQSRLVDIREYLWNIDEKKRGETREEKAYGLEMYQDFIMTLVRENSVQTKKDYLAISFIEEGKKREKDDPNSLKKYSNKMNEMDDLEDESIKQQREFEKAFKTLSQRVSTLEKQFRRLGVNPYPLSDEELFELFYTTYNKDRSSNQSMKDIDPADYTTMYVKRGG